MSGVAEFLEHYGTKGMKWGVRKRPDPNRSASKWKERKDKEREAKGGQPAPAGKSKKGKPDEVAPITGPKKRFKSEVSGPNGEKPKAGTTVESDGLTYRIDGVGKKLGAGYEVQMSRRLTDDELRAEVSRMQLEKQYRELSSTPAPAKQMTRGQKFAKEAGTVGMKIVTKSITEVGTQVVKKELQKQLKISQ
jgi:hypothetical protein